MTPKPAPICGQHNKKKEWKPTVFAYSEDGISIQVPNVYAWVCPEDGEASFTPETADELIVTLADKNYSVAPRESADPPLEATTERGDLR